MHLAHFSNGASETHLGSKSSPSLAPWVPMTRRTKCRSAAVKIRVCNAICSMPHLSFCCRYSHQPGRHSPDELKSARCAEFSWYPADNSSSSAEACHSQLFVIAHAIAWVFFFSLFFRDYLFFSRFFPLSFSSPPDPSTQNGQDQDH